MNDFDENQPSLLTPNTLLPVQYFTGVERARACSGPQRLMLAILEDAARIYARVKAPAPGGRKLLRETDRWVRSSDREWVFSFLRVCEALGLEPSVIRRGLLQLRLQASGLSDEPACHRAVAAIDQQYASVA